MKFYIILGLSAIFYCQLTYSASLSRQKRDLRDDLLTRAAELEKNATDEIEKLRAANRTFLAAGLQREETRVQEIAGELKNATGNETLRLLEGELILLEIRLANEVRALSNPAQTREQLLANAVRLEASVAAEVRTLEDEGRERLAVNLRREGERLQEIARELRLAENEMRIRILEVEIRLIENRVAEELRLLGVTAGTVGPNATTASGTARTATASGTEARTSVTASGTARTATASGTEARTSATASGTARTATASGTEARTATASGTEARTSPTPVATGSTARATTSA